MPFAIISNTLALFHGLFDNKLGQVRLVMAVGQNEVRPSDKPKANDLGFLLSNSFHGINRSDSSQRLIFAF